MIRRANRRHPKNAGYPQDVPHHGVWSEDLPSQKALTQQHAKDRTDHGGSIGTQGASPPCTYEAGANNNREREPDNPTDCDRIQQVIVGSGCHANPPFHHGQHTLISDARNLKAPAFMDILVDGYRPQQRAARSARDGVRDIRPPGLQPSDADLAEIQSGRTGQ